MMGFIVSGPVNQLATMREVLTSHVEVSHCQHLGIVTDEDPSPDETAARLMNMTRAAERWLEDRWYAPQTFRGVGADKNFRDLVYTHRGLMVADHRYYRANGMYDFPQTNLGMRLFNTLLLLLRSIPSLRKRMGKALMSGKMSAHRRVLENAVG
jgi:hypothetical protein